MQFFQELHVTHSHLYTLVELATLNALNKSLAFNESGIVSATFIESIENSLAKPNQGP